MAVFSIAIRALMDQLVTFVTTGITLILQVHVPNVMLLVMDAVEKVLIAVNNVQCIIISTMENVYHHALIIIMVIIQLLIARVVLTVVYNALMEVLAINVILVILWKIQVHVLNVMLLVMDVVEKVIIIVINV